MTVSEYREQYKRDQVAYNKAADRDKPQYWLRLKKSCAALLKAELKETKRQSKQSKPRSIEHQLFV